jgi:ribosome assembly protein RRB1
MSSGKKRVNTKQTGRQDPAASSVEEGLSYEDPYGDDIEEDIFEGMGEEGEQGDGDGERGEDEEDTGIRRAFRPGVDTLAEGEELIYDPAAYNMYHSLRTEWPCLSFDLFRDSLGDNRLRYPHSMFLMTGSQADKKENNQLTLLKLSDLGKMTKFDEDGDEENDDDDDDIDYEPVLEHVNVGHQGGVNRIRCMPASSGGAIQPGLVATMSDQGKAHVYDFRTLLSNLMAGQPYTKAMAPTKPAHTLGNHQQEGYALDWSPTVLGRIATGDCGASIHVWTDGVNHPAASQVFTGHKDSVEDIQWSPSEATVLCSASADKTVAVWDVRGSGPQISVDAHLDEVNVISWNRGVSYLLASGCDDGSFRVWDLRAIRANKPIANFEYHKAPITSLEWAPHDESVLCVSGADDQVTVWDLSVEADDEEERSRTTEVVASDDKKLEDFPPQLLFIHQGQHNVKEVHYHPHIPGTVVTTAEDGFNVFKPAINVA